MKKKSGSIFIELLVVLCLVAFLISLTIHNISFLDHMVVHMEIEKLYFVCHSLRQQAMATNREIIVTCDLLNNTYHYDDCTERLSQQVLFGFFGGVQGPPGKPEKMISSACTFPSERIHFYPTGIISSGTVYMTDKKKRHMYALSNAVSTVSYFRIYRYVDSAWKSITHV